MDFDIKKDAHWVYGMQNRQSCETKNKKGIIYTAMTKIAMKIAFDVHKNQSDKSGMPYILHPLHVAERVQGETAVCAALLHDVVEDSDCTFDMLLDSGISGEVTDVLKLLTHEPSVPYMDYIRGVKESGNQTAIEVKLADLEHNSDLTRLENIDSKSIERFLKYMDAMAILNESYSVINKEKIILGKALQALLDLGATDKVKEIVDIMADGETRIVNKDKEDSSQNA